MTTAAMTTRAAAPTAFHDLAERPGRYLPGGAAVLVALAAAGTCGWLLWLTGVVPSVRLAGHVLPPRPPVVVHRIAVWGALALLAGLAAFALAGLAHGRPGSVLLLTRHGAYRGTVRATGLMWISPLFSRRRLDVRLRHWRSSPIPVTDAAGTPLHATVLLVWRVRDTARAVFTVDDHVAYLREQVEADVARVLSRHPADDFGGGGQGPTLRDTEHLGDTLTKAVASAVRVIGLEVFSVQPVRLDYVAEIAPAMHRAHLAALDATHRRAVLDDVLSAVAETVRGLSDRGIAQLDDYEHKALVRDLTVAFYTARGPSSTPPYKSDGRSASGSAKAVPR